MLDQFIIGKNILTHSNIYYIHVFSIRAGQLVSPRRAPLASFICGWFNFIGNVAGKYIQIKFFYEKHLLSY